MSNRNTILIQGAVSEIGLEISEKLCNILKGKNLPVRGGYSIDNPQLLEKVKSHGCDCVRLDLEKLNEVNDSLKDVKSLVILTPYKENRVELVKRFIDRATDTGVQHIILVSVMGAQSGATKFQNDMKIIENHLQQKNNVNWTIFHCGAFYEDLFMQNKLIKEGSLLLPIGNNKIASVSLCDVAQLVAKTVTEPNLVKNKSIDVTGPESLSGLDMSKVMSEKFGRPINFVAVSVDEFKKRIKDLNTGIPTFKLDSLCDLYQWYSSGNGGRVSSDLNSVLGKQGTTFTEFVDSNKNRLVM